MSHQLTHHLCAPIDFISVRGVAAFDSGQSTDQSLLCSACTESLSNEIMIRKVNMICDLLSVFNTSKTTYGSKLKTSVTKIRLHILQKEKRIKGIALPKALQVFCLTFHKAFWRGQEGIRKNLNYSLRTGGV